eukprot:TRINITY_DN12377_c0_g1_i1.p1 TRINITY_DN12377_c0_g1~~TRINITY_DN12377_c0_g1_i1.p1  ORF type:complete len:705 (+),score=85.23 TRINITY_DN12377_c0_g1_i1:154-2268(+)
MPEAFEDAERLPGYVPAQESDEIETLPTTDSDAHREESGETSYETFVSDQLDALKAQLLAYHAQQSAMLKSEGQRPLPRPERLHSKFEKNDSSSSLSRKALNNDVVVDMITLPPVSEKLRRSSHRKRSAHAYARSLSSVRNPEREANPMWARFTLTEANRFRQVWSQAVVGVLIAYVATVFPYKLAFLDFRLPECLAEAIGDTTSWTCSPDDNDEPLAWSIVQWVVDVCFWVDLTLNFFVSYRNSEDFEVCDMRLIAKRYLKGMFFLDVLACLPSEFFQMIMNPNGHSSTRASPTRAINLTKLQRLTRLVRILRLRQLLKLAEVEWVQAIMRFRGFRMGGLTIGVIWVVHLMSSGWYIVAALESEPTQSWVARRSLPNGSTLLEQPPEVQWAHAMYFVLTVFTTVGFGDMSAYTTVEIIYVCMLMMVGGVVNGTVLSYVMNILEESDRKDVAINRTVNTLKDFADHTQLSSSLTHQMVTLARDRRVGAEVDSDGVKKLFSSLILPRHVVVKLPQNLWKGRLLKNEIFQQGRRLRQMKELPPRMTLFVASMLSMREFDQEEIIYSNGDLPLNIFLVLGGVFAYVATPRGLDTLDLAPYQLLGPRSYFGEYEMLSNIGTRVSTVRCETPCATALLLSKVDMFKLLADFPAFTSALRTLSIRREASRKRRRAKLVKLQNYEQLSCEIIARFAHKLYPNKQDPSKVWS